MSSECEHILLGVLFCIEHVLYLGCVVVVESKKPGVCCGLLSVVSSFLGELCGALYGVSGEVGLERLTRHVVYDIDDMRTP